MRKFILTILFGLSVLMAPAAVDSTLVRDHGDSIRVSLVTCSPGTEVYEVYGHTALRVEIPALGVDVAVNYGLFSFATPNFVWRFIKGETDYMVGTIGYPIFENEYTSRGSSVTLQTLNLSGAEKERLVYLLNENLRPENREYRYNFLYNNCSNKAGSMAESVLSVQKLPLTGRGEGSSYRDILHEYTADYPWMQFGIDYLLGVEADLPITPQQQMFAPEYLMYYTGQAQLADSVRTYPYVISSEVRGEAVDVPFVAPLLTPMQAMILLLMLVAVVCTFEFLIERRQWWFDVLLLLVQGAMGLVVAFLFFFSEHPTVGSNWQVIYLNPLPLLFIPFIIRSEMKRKVSVLYYVLLLMLAAAALVLYLTGQYVQPAAWLLMASLAVRTIHNAVIYPLLAHRFTTFNSVSNARAKALALLLCVSVTASAKTAETPKVVVSIVVDQLRGDYLNKFAHLYGEDGFKKLYAEGCIYTNGYYAHLSPDRSSSTASVYTGTTPYYHGITGNRFMRRNTLRVVGIVDDDDTKCKGINTYEGTSPEQLLVTTLPDELKIATKGHSCVCSIAPERDMAVLAGGHAADIALWLSEDCSKWATSAYYGSIPAWVRPFNHRVDTPFDWSVMTWEPYFSLDNYSFSMYDGTPREFRHTFRKGDEEAVRRYKTSALINDEVTKLAKSCVASGEFGQNKPTGMLCVGYYAGNYEHQPENLCPIELQDIYCRLDRNIAELIRAVEERVGEGNALFVITSTGYADAHRPDSKLISLPTGELKMDRCCALLNIYLGALYGKDNYVESSYVNEIFLNHAIIEKRQIMLSELLDRCTEFLCQVSGVKRVYSSLDLLSGVAEAEVRAGYNASRSGDLLLEVSPGWTLVDDRSNERVYYNRTHVPVPIIFYGNGFTAQRNRTPIAVESIAPTISHILHISAPNACAMRPIE